MTDGDERLGRDLQGGCLEAAGLPPRHCFGVTKAGELAAFHPEARVGEGREGKGGGERTWPVPGAVSFPPHSLTQERDHPSAPARTLQCDMISPLLPVCGLLAASDGPLKQRNPRGPQSSVYDQLYRHPGRLRAPF